MIKNALKRVFMTRNKLCHKKPGYLPPKQRKVLQADVDLIMQRLKMIDPDENNKHNLFRHNSIIPSPETIRSTVQKQQLQTIPIPMRMQEDDDQHVHVPCYCYREECTQASIELNDDFQSASEFHEELEQAKWDVITLRIDTEMAMWKRRFQFGVGVVSCIAAIGYLSVHWGKDDVNMGRVNRYLQSSYCSSQKAWASYGSTVYESIKSFSKMMFIEGTDLAIDVLKTVSDYVTSIVRASEAYSFCYMAFMGKYPEKAGQYETYPCLIWVR